MFVLEMRSCIGCLSLSLRLKVAQQAGLVPPFNSGKPAASRIGRELHQRPGEVHARQADLKARGMIVRAERELKAFIVRVNRQGGQPGRSSNDKEMQQVARTCVIQRVRKWPGELICQLTTGLIADPNCSSIQEFCDAVIFSWTISPNRVPEKNNVLSQREIRPKFFMTPPTMPDW